MRWNARKASDSPYRMAIGIGKAVTTVAKPIAMNIFFFDIIVVQVPEYN